MQNLSLIQSITVWVIPVLFAITLHEAAHAGIAYLCGDSTAKLLGRLSMNPLKHIDLIGTIIFPLTVALLSNFQFIFGWAKPVPINWNQLRRPRLDMALVALAGPGANLVMALLWALCLKVGAWLHATNASVSLFMILSGQAGIVINIVLGFLNLTPIPPLDGSRVIHSLLPPKLAYYYSKIEPFGFFILLILLITGILGWLLRPLLMGAVQFIYYLLGIQ